MCMHFQSCVLHNTTVDCIDLVYVCAYACTFACVCSVCAFGGREKAREWEAGIGDLHIRAN